MTNPFSMSVVGMCLGILLGSLMVPSSSLHTLDSALSLLLTFITLSLSLPPTKTFAHVLLQTAPSPTSTQMTHFRRIIKEIKDDRRILALSGVRCWTISAGTMTPVRYAGTPVVGTPNDSPLGSPMTPSFSFGAGSGHTPSDGSPTRGGGVGGYPFIEKSGSGGGGGGGKQDLVISLVVHVKEEMADEDLLEVTRMVYGKLAAGVGGGGYGSGVGEITVGVKRGEEGIEGE